MGMHMCPIQLMALYVIGYVVSGLCSQSCCSSHMTSLRKVGQSERGEVTAISNAAGFPLSHPSTSTSAGRKWLWSGVSSLHISILSWLCQSLHLRLAYTTAWWPRGLRATSGQREHREPLEVSIPSHHLIAMSTLIPDIWDHW